MFLKATMDEVESFRFRCDQYAGVLGKKFGYVTQARVAATVQQHTEQFHLGKLGTVCSGLALSMDGASQRFQHAAQLIRAHVQFICNRRVGRPPLCPPPQQQVHGATVELGPRGRLEHAALPNAARVQPAW